MTKKSSAFLGNLMANDVYGYGGICGILEGDIKGPASTRFL